MLMAARKLQGIGLVLLVLMFAMVLYLLSVNVASTRSELAQVNRDIAKSRDAIRYLESEFAVRASMRQLERWNSENFGYGAPVAGQYLAGERELASLDGLRPARGASEVAPVLMAMVSPVDLSNAAVSVAEPGASEAAANDAAPAAAAKRQRTKVALIDDSLLATATLTPRGGPTRTSPTAAGGAQ
jgi:hypothetical protein